jgi:hypothetical protein
VIHILWDKPYADEIVDIFRHTLESGVALMAQNETDYTRGAIHRALRVFGLDLWIGLNACW